MFKWDPDKERHVTSKREYYSEGHDMTYSVSTRKLRSMKNWAFKKKWDTECKTYPTSYFLKMDFPEVREDATATLSVSLKRTDAQKTELEVCVWIQICTLSQDLIYPKITFSKLLMSPDEVMQETIELSPLVGMKDSINKGITVHVTLMTNFCHMDPDSSDNRSSDSAYSEEY